MPKLAAFDPSAPAPAPVTGWYDTDRLDYPRLPDAVVVLDESQWSDRLQGRWSVLDGRLVASPLPADPAPG